MARQKTVTLAGEEYTISCLPMAQNRRWRERLNEPLARVVEIFDANRDLEIERVSDLLDIIKLVSDVALGSVDLIVDLLFDYSPELRLDRERIENNAYDEEALEAFKEVLALAFPLEMLIAVIRGRTATPTSLSSASQNGVNGTQKRTARSRA